jgi:leucyl-tRNA synthetase
MAERRYKPQEIEPRWQAVWADEHTWEVSNDALPGEGKDATS